MLLGLIFILGIANFAIHKAILESGHPVLDALPGLFRTAGGRVSLALEFVVLLVALLLTANGWAGSAWIYVIYSVVNIGSAWLMLSGRI